MQKALGWVMLLAGIFILFISITQPLATVIIDSIAPEIDSFMMAGKGSFFEISKDVLNPTQITKGLAHYFFGYVIENGNVSSGLMINILDSSNNNVFAMGLPETRVDPYFDTYIHQFYSSTVTWTPQSEGKYTINLAITDEAGNRGEDTRYIMVTSEPVEVTGYFTINGIKIEVPGNVTITLTTKSLVFQFVCTSGAENVGDGEDRPKIIGFPDTTIYMNRQQGSDIWIASYTVSKDGTYTIHGVVTTKRNEIKVFMSIIAVIGSPRKMLELNFLTMLGLGSTAIGLLLIFTGRRKRGG